MLFLKLINLHFICSNLDFMCLNGGVDDSDW